MGMGHSGGGGGGGGGPAAVQAAQRVVVDVRTSPIVSRLRGVPTLCVRTAALMALLSAPSPWLMPAAPECCPECCVPTARRAS